MTQSPARRELQPLAEPASRQIEAVKSAWHRTIAIVTNPSLVMICAFCAIGLLVTVNLILHFPNFGAMMVEYEQFP